MNAGIAAVRARKARMAAALSKIAGGLSEEQLDYAVGFLVRQGVSVRQVEAIQPNIEARELIWKAILKARAYHSRKEQS